MLLARNIYLSIVKFGWYLNQYIVLYIMNSCRNMLFNLHWFLNWPRFLKVFQRMRTWNNYCEVNGETSLFSRPHSCISISSYIYQNVFICLKLFKMELCSQRKTDDGTRLFSSQTYVLTSFLCAAKKIKTQNPQYSARGASPTWRRLIHYRYELTHIREPHPETKLNRKRIR